MNRNSAGKMKTSVGKSIFTGALLASSSAATWRFSRASAGLDAQDASERASLLLGLDDRAHDGRELGHADALREVVQRALPRLAHPDLAERQLELVRERAVQPLDQLLDRAVEAEPRLDRDGEQVERIREHRPDASSAGAA